MIKNIKKNYFFIFFFLSLFFTTSLKANNVAVLDIEYIINNNKQYINLLNDIDTDQLNHRNNFKKIEDTLKEQYEEIENSKIILTEKEFENLIIEYNIEIKNFDEEIKKFNNHYEVQISNYRNLIIEKILIIIKKYAISKEIDLILDSKNYIMASNSIDITEIILKEINELQIDINFEPY